MYPSNSRHDSLTKIVTKEGADSRSGVKSASSSGDVREDLQCGMT